MSEQKSRYTILGAGEHYKVELDPKRYGGGSGPETKSIEEAREQLGPRAKVVLREVERLPAAARLAETVIELRMGERFTAKSYHPSDLLEAVGLRLRGTGTWTKEAQLPRSARRTKRDRETEPGQLRSRALFVSGPQKSLEKLVRAVSSGVSARADADIVKLEDIRLPTAVDRLKISGVKSGPLLAVEIVLYDWRDSLLKEALAGVRRLLRGAGVAAEEVRVRTYPNGPTFIAAVVPRAIAASLGELNYLRSARMLPRVGLSEAVVRKAFSSSATTQPASSVDLPEVAVFDGGYHAGNSLLDPYVTDVSLTAHPPTTKLLEHGTLVTSAIVYGPFDDTGAIPAPVCRVRNFRVLPDPKNDHLELYGVIDAVESQVPKLGDSVAVVNLSLGPEAPLDDDVPARFTYALDRLARDHGKLFVTAAGNWGERPGQERVQPPADSVNNLAVGAYRFASDGTPEYARYSCRGRGRSGGTVKPDLVAFGGCAARPFFGLVAPGMLIGDMGTSFAAPLASALAARLIGHVSTPTPLLPEALRALLINGAREIPGATVLEVGHGALPETLDQILECSAKRVSVLYQGVLSPRQGWKLPFLLPVGFASKGNVRFSWTVALSPDVMQSTPDEYTLGGVELGFRPHADVYNYAPPRDSNLKPQVVNIEEDWKLAEQLELDGWKRAQLPVPDSRASGMSERKLRADEGKWETVVRDSRGKRSNSISEPMLTIHVQGRGNWDRRDPSLQARYAAVLTVDAPKYDGDLYDEIVRLYPRVGPLTVRTRARVTRI